MSAEALAKAGPLPSARSPLRRAKGGRATGRSAKAGRRADPLIDGARRVGGRTPVRVQAALPRRTGGRPPRNGRTRFGGKAGPTGLPYAVVEIGLPSTEEHSDGDQGGEGADKPDQNGDFLQSFHENLVLQPWSAVTRRGRLPPLHEPTCTYGAVTLKPPPACRGLTRVADGHIRCGRRRSSGDFDPRAVIGSEDHGAIRVLGGRRAVRYTPRFRRLHSGMCCLTRPLVASRAPRIGGRLHGSPTASGPSPGFIPRGVDHDS